MLAPNQSTFISCYRNRHHPIFHLAYLRLAKVCFIEELIAASTLALNKAAIFDYGFGAGTFFYRCPKSASLYGIELDEESIEIITAALHQKGHERVDLRRSEKSADIIRFWPEIRFDLIICSHVLEHVPNPRELLEDLSSRLSSRGRIICLVPLNEIGSDPKHVNHFNQKSLNEVCQAAGLKTITYLEEDYWMYWFQPLFLRTGKFSRLLIQIFSFLLGLFLCAPGWRFWKYSGRLWSRLTASKPTQAGVVLSL